MSVGRRALSDQPLSRSGIRLESLPECLVGFALQADCDSSTQRLARDEQVVVALAARPVVEGGLRLGDGVVDVKAGGRRIKVEQRDESRRPATADPRLRELLRTAPILPVLSLRRPGLDTPLLYGPDRLPMAGDDVKVAHSSIIAVAMTHGTAMLLRGSRSDQMDDLERRLHVLHPFGHKPAMTLIRGRLGAE